MKVIGHVHIFLVFIVDILHSPSTICLYTWADIFTCKNTGVNNKTNAGWILFSCISFLVLIMLAHCHSLMTYWNTHLLLVRPVCLFVCLFYNWLHAFLNSVFTFTRLFPRCSGDVLSYNTYIYTVWCVVNENFSIALPESL